MATRPAPKLAAKAAPKAAPKPVAKAAPKPVAKPVATATRPQAAAARATVAQSRAPVAKPAPKPVAARPQTVQAKTSVAQSRAPQVQTPVTTSQANQFRQPAANAYVANPNFGQASAPRPTISQSALNQAQAAQTRATDLQRAAELQRVADRETARRATATPAPAPVQQPVQNQAYQDSLALGQQVSNQMAAQQAQAEQQRLAAQQAQQQMPGVPSYQQQQERIGATLQPGPVATPPAPQPDLRAVVQPNPQLPPPVLRPPGDNITPMPMPNPIADPMPGPNQGKMGGLPPNRIISPEPRDMAYLPGRDYTPGPDGRPLPPEQDPLKQAGLNKIKQFLGDGTLPPGMGQTDPGPGPGVGISNGSNFYMPKPGGQGYELVPGAGTGPDNTMRYVMGINDPAQKQTIMNEFAQAGIKLENERGVQPNMFQYYLNPDQVNQFQSDPRFQFLERPLEDMGLFPTSPGNAYTPNLNPEQQQQIQAQTDFFTQSNPNNQLSAGQQLSNTGIYGATGESALQTGIAGLNAAQQNLQSSPIDWSKYATTLDKSIYESGGYGYGSNTRGELAGLDAAGNPVYKGSQGATYKQDPNNPGLMPILPGAQRMGYFDQGGQYLGFGSDYKLATPYQAPPQPSGIMAPGNPQQQLQSYSQLLSGNSPNAGLNPGFNTNSSQPTGQLPQNASNFGQQQQTTQQANPSMTGKSGGSGGPMGPINTSAL